MTVTMDDIREALTPIRSFEEIADEWHREEISLWLSSGCKGPAPKRPTAASMQKTATRGLARMARLLEANKDHLKRWVE